MLASLNSIAFRALPTRLACRILLCLTKLLMSGFTLRDLTTYVRCFALSYFTPPCGACAGRCYPMRWHPPTRAAWALAWNSTWGFAASSLWTVVVAQMCSAKPGEKQEYRGRVHNSDQSKDTQKSQAKTCVDGKRLNISRLNSERRRKLEPP